MAAGGQRRNSDSSDTWLGDAYYNAVVALIVLVPVTYVLLLVLRFVLFATGSAHYVDSKDFLIAGTSGVLVGSALMALLSLKGTLKKIAKDGPASVDVSEHVGSGVWVRAPFALLVAGLTDMPDGRAAHVVTGVYWGAVTAGLAMLHTVFVNKRPVAKAWFGVVVAEVLVVLCFIGGVIRGLRNHATLVTSLEVGPAAAAACTLTYLVVLLGARIARRGG
nr:hypothetical protein [Kibdelosporangium sp. MJ126-NF4]CEL18244.1 hypothetical protein [Kibdelosporangium sp. MJ126-NF4]CTQ90526.1 hypothetical protein [Kibdelosporangium sp. MJ126-NF4]